MTRRKAPESTIICTILIAAALLISGSAYPAVPGQINFQGVLLDDTSQLVNGTVDFNFALYDESIGGTQLWAESQNVVPVNGGVYTVALGSVTPITTSILTGNAVYLEVTVDGDIISPRQRLLAVPYALEAEDALNVTGVPGMFIQQLYQHINYDGQSLPNDDPLQGVDDIDGDGLANFMDPDNDGDSITDDMEIANGTGVNLPTPTILTIVSTSTSTASARAGVAGMVTITGTGFLTGLSVQAGPESPAPQNLTSTGFDITIGAAQSPGPASITVTNPNAESAVSTMYFYDKLVFITRDDKLGMNQTAASADSFCAQAAAAAGLPGTFVAWFSDTDNNISAIDRITIPGTWARLDGATVASGISDLTDGSLEAPINVDEYGNPTTSNTAATNTLISGSFDPDSCSLSSPGSGKTGNPQATDSRWTENSTALCNTTHHPYYCFEQ